MMERSGFVTSIAYDEKCRVFGITTTDGLIHFYSKSRIRIEHQKSYNVNPKPKKEDEQKSKDANKKTKSAKKMPDEPKFKQTNIFFM